ncbi:MAG TPA: DUF86 domain-containing protein [Bdellovibrionota bacterium]|nr:DUF86 domain-containing protein [Bdellovibrionota bacterium]
MVDRALVTERLKLIDDYLRLAERLSRNARKRFIENPEIHMLAERALHLALEAMLDVSSHIVSARNLGPPQSYGDVIFRLAEGGVIPERLAHQLRPWVGMRNVLVHGYSKLDHGQVHQAIRRDLSSVRRFCAAVSKLL